MQHIQFLQEFYPTFQHWSDTLIVCRDALIPIVFRYQSNGTLIYLYHIMLIVKIGLRLGQMLICDAHRVYVMAANPSDNPLIHTIQAVFLDNLQTCSLKISRHLPNLIKHAKYQNPARELSLLASKKKSYLEKN